MSAGPLLALALLSGCVHGDGAVVILTAASTGDVVERVAEAEREGGRPTLVSVAASSVLAQQIVHGAPADVFVTADPAWTDWLIAHGVRIVERRVVAGGRLVVVGPAGAPAARSLAEALGPARVALADPAHVPAGRYAHAALAGAGLWEAVADRVVPLGDVRAALAAVETGAADRAVVYASDARASARVRVLADVPGPAVVFEAALLDPRARGAFDALTGPASAERWAAAGFDPVAR